MGYVETGGQSAAPASELASEPARETTGELLAPQPSESGGEASLAPSNVELFLGEIEIHEHDVLQLGVTFEDPDVEASHTAIIDWGDGTAPESFAIDPGARFLGTSHQYRDDNPGGTPEDVNTIEVTIVDTDDNQTTATAAVTVKNIAPTIDTLSVTPLVSEGQTAHLRGTFSDPGTQDTFELDIDWDGDERFDQTVAVAGGEFLVARQFLDDNPSGTPSDTVNINVRLRDDDTGSDADQVSLTVRNVDPTIPVLIPFSSVVNEGGDVDLLLIFGDRGVFDTHTIEVDWGDDTEVELIEVSTPGSSLQIISHVYLDDDPSSTPSDFYQIRVVVTDDDGGRVARNTQVQVRNVDPVLTLVENQVIDEGALLDLTSGGLGSWIDEGVLDTHTASVNWGDGSPTESITVDQASGTGSLGASHRYADDGLMTVTVTLEDDDLGVVEKQFTVTVNNVPPLLTIGGDAMIDEGSPYRLSLGSSDPGDDTIMSWEIDWGDGSVEAVAGNPSSAVHRYADDGNYSIRAEAEDEDGVYAANSLTVAVKNVSPVVLLDPVERIDENGVAALSGSIADPGSLDTFTLDITWGDPLSRDNTQSFELGTLELTESASGIVWDPVARTFLLQHQYLDDNPSGTTSDTYTIDVRATDDDLGEGFGSSAVLVDNLPPMIDTLSVLPSSINESESVTIIGTFSDVGSLDLHRIEIRWGDGKINSDGGHVAFTQELNGSGSLIATHTYLDNDTTNPDDLALDNNYSIIVTVTDDDGGEDIQGLDLEVLNVNPVLERIAQEDATDVNSRGETSVIITFSDIGADLLNVWVDWGDIRDPSNPFLPGDDPFVLETVDGNSVGEPIAMDGPGTFTIVLTHKYQGPPNPLSPAADIVISVVVVDDDFNLAAAGGQVDGPMAGQLIVEPGRSDFQQVKISNSGIGTTPIVIDTTPQVPRLVFPLQDEIVFYAGSNSEDEGGAQTTDLRTAVGDTKSTTDRYLELRVIDPASGTQSEGYRLKPEVLNDLPGLFRTLPDNHYAIYLVRTETNSRRLVIEVYVRNGKLIDPGDDSEGTRDRPPTDEATNGFSEEAIEQPRLETEPDESLPLIPAKPAAPTGLPPATPADPAAGAASANSEQVGAEQRDFGHLVGHGGIGYGAGGYEAGGQRAGGGLAARSFGSVAVGLAVSKSARSWAERIDQAIATADAQQWRRLQRRRSHKRQ